MQVSPSISKGTYHKNPQPEQELFNLTSYPVAISPARPSLLSKVGLKILEYISSPAQANPLAAAALMEGGAVAAPGVVAANGDDWWSSTTFPGTINDFSKGKDHIYPSPIFGLNSGLLISNGVLNLYRKGEEKLKERINKPDPDKKYVPIPKKLIGFPDAVKISGKTPYPGGIRSRWEMPGGKILEWDSQHGEIEMYDKRGKHLGSYDPDTGQKVKDPEKNRSIKKYL
jgi:hypothetical protein